ncbi:MAG: tetratricopeptide repeat protein [Muribaculaceae bacterium]|nr:tetratricopeptide repeat protein [Muribaculaceae bacterium]
MRTIYLFAILVLTSVLSCKASDSLVARADSAYSEDNFAEALQLYNEASTHGTSSSLYYNIGNCHYRLGQLGQSIVAYERALRLDPNNADAKANLAFVNDKIIDRQGERGTFISNTFDNISFFLGSDSWAWISLVLFIVFIAAVAIYTFTSNIPLRKVGFFGGIIVLLLCISCMIFSFHSASLSNNKNFAIITAPSTILSTSPRVPKDRNEEAMLLHEGTKVEIRDSVSSHNDSTNVKWYDVQVDNAHRAWIKSSDIEKI